MRKINYLITFILCLLLLFSGCALFDPLPDEYVKGVKFSKDYPDNDFEIYDNAIVYKADEDEDEVSISYGIEDDIDDVIGFYEDMFDDKELTIEELENDEDEFYAKGYSEDFRFEVTIEAPRGDYEERAFTTVVEVDIEFLEVGEITSEKLQGFWLSCGIDGQLSDDSRMVGYAIEFSNAQMDFYGEFVESTIGTDFTFIDNDTISYLEDGKEYTFNIVFETIDGIEVLSLTDEYFTQNFEKSSYDEMMLYQEMAKEETLKKMQGFWHFCGEKGVLSDKDRMDGVAIEFKDMKMDFYANYTVDTLDNDFIFIDSDTINYTEEGDEYTVDIAFETIDGIDVMSLSILEHTINLEKSSFDEMLEYKAWDIETGTVILLEDELTDAELEFWISEVAWTRLGYMYSDQTYAETDMFFEYIFFSDYSASFETDDSIDSVSWYVKDGNLYLVYPNETYYWAIDFELDADGRGYLLMYDMEEGYEGGFWVYTVK